MPRTDVLIVYLGGTTGLRLATEDLAGSLRRAGASVQLAAAIRPPELRTLAALELAWALNARRAAREAIAAFAPRTILYSTTTAALLWPAPGAIRFDAPAAGNRPGRHGLWQRPVERRRFVQSPLLVPCSDGGLAEAPVPRAGAVIVPIPVAPSGPVGERDIAAITYAANPSKKGLDIVLAAWARASREGEELVVAGLDEREGAEWRRRSAGGGRVRFAGHLAHREYRALLRRSRVFVNAARREDYGAAQLEALADGCVLVTTESPGPYAALPLARALDPRLVGAEPAIRTALDDPVPSYAERARELLAPFSPAAVDAVVARELLPRLVLASA